MIFETTGSSCWSKVKMHRKRHGKITKLCIWNVIPSTALNCTIYFGTYRFISTMLFLIYFGIMLELFESTFEVSSIRLQKWSFRSHYRIQMNFWVFSIGFDMLWVPRWCRPRLQWVDLFTWVSKLYSTGSLVVVWQASWLDFVGIFSCHMLGVVVTNISSLKETSSIGILGMPLGCCCHFCWFLNHTM